MSSRIINVVRTARAPGGALVRQVRRLGRRKDGATVVEFALVIFPFLAILFAIVEIALVFFAGQVLETATADTARRIMTGEVQKAGMSQTQFKNALCARVHALFNCQNGIHIDVKNYSNFTGASVAPPLNEDGELDTSGFGFSPGVQGNIVVVRVAYEWPIYVRDFGFNLASLPNGKRLLMATAAFRNEPYKN
jgi:Flp pilus assembly protein TadG